MKKNSNNFWNNRALNKKLPGSNDPFLDFFETKKIISLLKIKKNLNILDIGCGSGELLQKINKNKKINRGVGIDFSNKMILKAKRKNKSRKIKYYNIDMNKIDDIRKYENIKFDYIITKRAIINVLSRKKQLKVINNLGNFLKTSGSALLCECSRDDQININKIRSLYNLKPINPPWHNLYFSDSVLKNHKVKKMKLVKIHDFSSTFYFVSRIINALDKKMLKKNAKFNDNINKIGWMLDSNLIKGYSQTKIYQYTKKN